MVYGGYLYRLLIEEQCSPKVGDHTLLLAGLCSLTCCVHRATKNNVSINRDLSEKVSNQYLGRYSVSTMIVQLSKLENVTFGK